MNASPQRAQIFTDVQTEYPALAPEEGSAGGKLRLLQDVKTRWNSTYLMLVRCIRLRRAIDAFWSQIGGDGRVATLKLDGTEWKKVEYLVKLMKPYAMHGATLSAAVQPTIDMVYEKYNSIFDHLDAKKNKLQLKQQAWKKQLLPALEAARSKLSFYYAMTKGELGEMYNIGNMLNPSQKNSIYCRREWEPESYAKLTKAFVAYFQQHYSAQPAGSGSRNSGQVVNAFDLWTLAQRPAGRRLGGRSGNSEIIEYLNEGE